MKELRCIALDLDGTTLGQGGVLSGRTRAALERAAARGIAIVVASGRAYNSLPQSVLQLPGVRYAVTSNGAAVHNVKDASCIRRCLLPADTAAYILRMIEGEQVCIECFIDGHAFSDAVYLADPVRWGASPHALPYLKATRKPVEDMASFLSAHAAELDSIDVVVPDAADKARLWKLLEETGNDIYVTSSVPQLLEIAHKDAGKRAGLAAALEALGLTPEQTAAFGDADNDIDMLRYAGLGVAMENGTAAARKSADRIAPANTEDGVAIVLEELFDAADRARL